MTFEDVLLRQSVCAEAKYADRLVIGARGQFLSVATPVNRVDFAGVRNHLPSFMIFLETCPDLIHRGLHHADALKRFLYVKLGRVAAVLGDNK